jgi:hypothetical protein
VEVLKYLTKAATCAVGGDRDGLGMDLEDGLILG